MKQNQFTEQTIWQYCLDHTKPNSPLLQALKADTESSVHGAQMLSETIVTKLLQFFIKMQNPKICVDLGTFSGLSALAMAEATADNALIYTIDRTHQSGHELACKYIEESSVGYKVKMLIQEGIDAISKLPDDIDFAFIDADKMQTQCYFDLLLPKLSAKGMIIVDDVLWRGEVLDPVDKRAKALDDFNQYICSHPQVDNLILPIRHGLHLIIKK
ncbi:O-methyltransferase [Cysteiniphilum litorale]|uniref:O-methyltransferase n=1 Tax=Cysteiniphilum litorale TaxID=2056700 RepID=UPI003F8830FA